MSGYPHNFYFTIFPRDHLAMHVFIVVHRSSHIILLNLLMFQAPEIYIAPFQKMKDIKWIQAEKEEKNYFTLQTILYHMCEAWK